ncbi:hypothetical protein HUW51_05205 [Adhaeribacter swui]|uniref:Uncharacterized protein n=1 Tax=Adhaeribacter swui TaxID=2086471 RepID=A0A7G7G4S2_9BACT|nr:hypothetical protein [Adhaeribacter swui]QNF32156.1 hypothetical protein HUW51_05205 [Adhaeribacter swui]
MTKAGSKDTTSGELHNQQRMKPAAYEGRLKSKKLLRLAEAFLKYFKN